MGMLIGLGKMIKKTLGLLTTFLYRYTVSGTPGSSGGSYYMTKRSTDVDSFLLSSQAGIMTSTNLTDWYRDGSSTGQDFQTTSDYGIATDKNKTVVMSTTNGQIGYSTDGGLTWSKKSLESLSVDGVVYGNNKFVAFGDGNTKYSYDGINWFDSTMIGLPLDSGYKSYGYIGGRFYAKRDENIYGSVDGQNWTQDTLPADLHLAYFKLAYIDSKYYTVIQRPSFSLGYNYSSTDLRSWVKETGTVGSYLDAAYGYFKFVAVGDGYVATDDFGDGGWSEASIAYNLSKVIYTGDSFYAIGTNSNEEGVVLRNQYGDNNSWVLSHSSATVFTDIFYEGSNVIVSGSSSKYATSGSDSWSTLQINNINGILNREGVWVATTSNGLYYSSGINQTWQSVNQFASHGLSYGLGKFACLRTVDANSDKVLYSDNGTSWVEGSDPHYNPVPLYNMVFDGSNFVLNTKHFAYGDTYIYYTQNFSTYTQKTFSGAQGIRDLIVKNNNLFVMGYYSTEMYTGGITGSYSQMYEGYVAPFGIAAREGASPIYVSIATDKLSFSDGTKRFANLMDYHQGVELINGDYWTITAAGLPRYGNSLISDGLGQYYKKIFSANNIPFLVSDSSITIYTQQGTVSRDFPYVDNIYYINGKYIALSYDRIYYTDTLTLGWGIPAEWNVYSPSGTTGPSFYRILETNTTIEEDVQSSIGGQGTDGSYLEELLPVKIYTLNSSDELDYITVTNSGASTQYVDFGISTPSDINTPVWSILDQPVSSGQTSNIDFDVNPNNAIWVAATESDTLTFRLYKK